uniref:Aspergillus nuclease S1 n=1 Tax=Elaeis guineensis var. tenera TaxID=51953 RepID=A0A6J0PIR0_ELAGV|nr:LOW QUALITY PROTEIN: uncharacterized protein LOC109505844 [Elaeis guineensis]
MVLGALLVLPSLLFSVVPAALPHPPSDHPEDGKISRDTNDAFYDGERIRMIMVDCNATYQELVQLKMEGSLSDVAPMVDEARYEYRGIPICTIGGLAASVTDNSEYMDDDTESDGSDSEESSAEEDISPHEALFISEFRLVDASDDNEAVSYGALPEHPFFGGNKELRKEMWFSVRCAITAWRRKAGRIFTNKIRRKLNKRQLKSKEHCVVKYNNQSGISMLGIISIGSFLILLQFVPGTLSWGKEGHYGTSKIAEGLLTEEAMAAVKMLLPEYANGDLAAVCSWADEIRHSFRWHWTSPLHSIDTPDFKCNYNYCRDCHDFARRKDRCVAGESYNYSAQLSAYQYPHSEHRYNLTEALLFLSHFMGDIHQLLHVRFAGDEGGNTVMVHWYRRKTNLHHEWDDMSMKSALKKFFFRSEVGSNGQEATEVPSRVGFRYNLGFKALKVLFTEQMYPGQTSQQFYNSDLKMLVQSLQTIILKDWSTYIPSWEHYCGSNKIACPNLYASEGCIRLACKFAYRNATPGSTLADEYFLTRLPIVEERLAQGGFRLAATLNRIFLPHHPFHLKSMSR